MTSIGPSITSVSTVGAVETGPTGAFIAVIHLPVDFGFIEVVDEVPTVAASGEEEPSAYLSISNVCPPMSSTEGKVRE